MLQEPVFRVFDFSPVANLLNQLAPAHCHKVLRLEQKATVAGSVAAASNFPLFTGNSLTTH